MEETTVFKKLFIVAVVVISIIAIPKGAKSWLKSLLPDKAHFAAIKQTKISDLQYVTEDIPEYRGKILAVVTSVDSMGEDKPTGYEHTELARAYFVFIANGFDVDIASPQGGKPPVVYDDEDMGEYDYAFINDAFIQNKVAHSIPLAEINPDDYEAVYFVGGKGTMFDFPDNKDIKRIAKSLYQNNKVVSAVCHGPAALINVTLDNGVALLSNKKISGFTNEEELTLIPDAKDIFPFLLEDKLIEQGAQFKSGANYLEQVSQDGKIITGQNPWSVWRMAEMVVAEIGYQPKARMRTPEEFAVDLLIVYQNQGYEAALTHLRARPDSIQKILLVMHGVMAFMQFEIGNGIDIFKLAVELKNLTKT
mgnify:CR=1 FL=1